MIQTGLENFLNQIDNYKNRKIGLIVNQTSVTRDFRYSWHVFRKEGLHIQRIFSPEHGLFATEQDQIAVMAQPEVPGNVVSLYGSSQESLIPHNGLTDDIDLVIFDIQDVGSRYYTYVNTMALFMKAIDKKDIEMLILDRPNPLGGSRIEGPLIDKAFHSFVGILPVPVRHGMTAGELAFLYRDTEKIDIHLSVLKMTGWDRNMLYPDTDLHWIPPSPNMPTVETTFIYPGMCLLEGLNVSEGRGTTTPFQVCGAPFIEPGPLIRHLKNTKLRGVVFRPYYFKPTFHKYRDEVVNGIFIHVTDLEAFRPFRTGVALTKSLFYLYRGEMDFLKDTYEFNSIHPAFDLLTGDSHIREMIQRDCTIDEIEDSWKTIEDTFAEVKKGYHLYDT